MSVVCVVCVDVGQTGMRVESPSGLVETARAGEPLTSAAAIDRLAADIVAFAPYGGEFRVGATGIGPVTTASALADALVAHGACTAIVSSDRVSGFLGALPDRDGVVLTAGTGVVGFAVSGERAATIGGAGWAIDDEGGGFSVGRNGLRAALRAIDGRGPATKLAAAAVDVFGAPDGWQQHIMESGTPVATIAGFVPAMAEVAASGDVVARRIWSDAADALTEVVSAAWAAAGGERPPHVAVVGGLVRAGEVLTGPLAERLAASASVSFRADASLAGVRELERQRARPALSPLIAISEDS